MKQTLIRCMAVAVAVLAAGCASVGVSDDAIKQRTSIALGVPQDSFVVSNRVDDGVRSDYMVKTRDGAQYNCYVTGTVSVIGRVVSDAMCTKMGTSGRKKVEGTCNALLKAAGKC